MKFTFKFHQVGHLLKESVNGFIDDNGMKLGAALSYYTIFSLPPLLIIIISISGFFFGEDAVRGEIYSQINDFMGNEVALQIQEIVKNVKLYGSSTFATTVGIIVLVIGASGVFSEIQDSINYIWGIRAKPRKGLIKFIKNRLMSFSMIGSMGFLLMVSLVVNSIMDILSARLERLFPQEVIYLFYGINWLILFIIIAVLFTIIFKSLPDGKVVLKDCVVGASFTSFLFMIGKFAIGAYLSSSTILSAYDAAGSIIMIFVWVYYSAIILYFGAEFTKVYAEVHGDKIIPNEYSEQVVKVKI